MPSLSTNPGGKILLANARRKMAPNSESRPPIPISSNLKLGWMIAFGGGRFAEALIFMLESGALKKVISVCGVRIPLVFGEDVVVVSPFSNTVRSTHSMDLMTTFNCTERKSIATFCPGENIWFWYTFK
jgi:hypothetical protein